MKTLKLKISIVAALLFCILTQLANAQTLTIATAANFRDPMTEIIKEFQAENPEVTIKPVFGSSGNLYNQITNSAPFDIFFSANVKYPQKVYEAGMSYAAPEIYAIGQLVLWSKSLDMTAGLEVLKTKEASRIAIANPDLAPYGKSAVACMKYYKLYEELESKIVTAENIAQTAQFAVTGNADVGFLAKSQLKMEAIAGNGSFFDLPTESYPPIKQAFVVIKKEENELLTQKFIDFIGKPEIQKIITGYGYGLGK